MNHPEGLPADNTPIIEADIAVLGMQLHTRDARLRQEQGPTDEELEWAYERLTRPEDQP